MEKEEEKKKAKNSSKVLIIILAILLLAAISYIILDKTGVLDSITSSNKETETKNTTEKANTKSDYFLFRRFRRRFRAVAAAACGHHG